MQKKVLLAGGSGLIGRQIRKELQAKGYHVCILSRGKSQPGQGIYHWDPFQGIIDPEALSGCYGVINLAGAAMVRWPWTTSRKQLLVDSRVRSTAFLIDQILRSKQYPEVFINGSASGYYPDRNDEWLREDTAPDDDFLGKTCALWEAALTDREPLPFRTCIVRTGLVTSYRGGIYPLITMSMHLKIAGYLGRGEMFYSWIHIEDMARLMIFLLENKNSSGSYNGTSPQPLTMKSWVQTMARQKKAWITIRIPAWIIRLFTGSFADILLKGGRLSADKIQREGFKFRWTDWPAAIRDLESRKI